MIHYPISTLFLAGIREILIITTDEDQAAFRRLLGDGSQYGVSFSFMVQESPKGIAEAFKIGAEFINNQEVALILGDNVFYGSSLGTQLRTIKNVEGAIIFAHKVSDPERYGVVELDSSGQVIDIEEKPNNPKSDYAIPGLYFYDSTVCEKAELIKPSARGELEITSINRIYLEEGNLGVRVIPRGTSWFDTGTFQALQSASAFIQIVEEREGVRVACLEEIAWRNDWISATELSIHALGYGDNNPFKKYLLDLIIESISES